MARHFVVVVLVLCLAVLAAAVRGSKPAHHMTSDLFSSHLGGAGLEDASGSGVDAVKASTLEDESAVQEEESGREAREESRERERRARERARAEARREERRASEEAAERKAEQESDLSVASTLSDDGDDNLDRIERELKVASDKVAFDETAELRAPPVVQEVILEAMHRPRELGEASEVVAQHSNMQEILHAAKSFISFDMARYLPNLRPSDPKYVACMGKLSAAQDIGLGEGRERKLGADVLIGEDEEDNDGEDEGEGEDKPFLAMRQVRRKVRKVEPPLRLDGPTAFGRPFKIVSGPGLFAVVETIARRCLLMSQRRDVIKEKDTINSAIRSLFAEASKNPTVARKAQLTQLIAAQRAKLVPVLRKEGSFNKKIGLLTRMSKHIKWEDRLRLAVQFKEEQDKAQAVVARTLRGVFARDGTLKLPKNPARRATYIHRLDNSFNRRVMRLSRKAVAGRIREFLALYLDAGDGVSPNYNFAQRLRYKGRVPGAGVGSGSVNLRKLSQRGGDEFDYNPEEFADVVYDKDSRKGTFRPGKNLTPRRRKVQKKDKVFDDGEPAPGVITYATRN